jgi:endogenous inhibitor of DNA gyrase (YacG/DUF329 family)
MTTERIKQVLESGQCPECQADVESDETMTTFFCVQNKDHFKLVVTFHGGEKITATLNDEIVDEDELAKIEW